MRMLHAAGHRRMPWKNGGGETTEIAVSPEGASIDDFDWRVSMARVERDGPFSVFPGVDRTLAILEGQGIMLDVEGRGTLTLTRASEPATFPADAPTSCALIAGPILDLNVMSRRDRVSHTVDILAVSAPMKFLAGARDTLVLCLEGTVDIAGDTGSETLSRFDCLVAGASSGALQLDAAVPARVALIAFQSA
ncbi:HutD family protein [Mesorhizobium sp. CAU 1732]|uniref:HutD/Ves family protein n=1 Tax=Mesorhizobium sp. CAU 1732 TaxID=3140358 RepID=UPI003260FFA7